MKANEIVSRLRRLSKEAGANVYERCHLAAELLADKAWIDSEHGGDDFAALEAIEDDFFHDLAVPLTDLVRLTQHFPDEKDWAARHYNLRKMLAALKVGGNAERPAARRATLKEVEDLRDKVKRFEAANKNLDRSYLAAQNELAQARERIGKLEKENERLKGRVEELEGIIARHFQKRPA